MTSIRTLPALLISTSLFAGSGPSPSQGVTIGGTPAEGEAKGMTAMAPPMSYLEYINTLDDQGKTLLPPRGAGITLR